MKTIPTTAVVSAMLAAGLLTTTTLVTADDDGREYRRGGDQQIAMMRGGAMGGERFFERNAERLELTDEQRTSLRAIFDAHRDEQRSVGDRLRAGRQAVRAAMEADAIDPEAIRTLANAQGEAMADLIVLRATMASELRAVLTPEQREEMKSLREERREKRGKRGRRHG